MAILMGQGQRVRIPRITAYAPYGHNRIVHIYCSLPCAGLQVGEGGLGETTPIQIGKMAGAPGLDSETGESEAPSPPRPKPLQQLLQHLRPTPEVTRLQPLNGIPNIDPALFRRQRKIPSLPVIPSPLAIAARNALRSSTSGRAAWMNSLVFSPIEPNFLWSQQLIVRAILWMRIRSCIYI